MMTDNAKYDQMAVIMKAMAHPTRLFILDQLKEKEHCVCELQELIGADMSTVSKHLSVLKNAGIIDNRKQNNQVFYSLICPCVLDVYQCVIEVNQNKKF
jgi:ArsR family transcriptional regulator, arsenate/arsenite/antimonite-responsive transcriptional repressor